LGCLVRIIAIVLFVGLPPRVHPQDTEVPISPPNPETLPKWEDEIINGYLPYHQLTTDDFPVKDSGHPGMTYWMEPFLHYYYHSIGRAQHGMVFAYVKDWTVFSGFNKNLSGRKSNFRTLKEELPYVQAFLDLNELYARQMAALQPAEFPRGSGKSWAEAQRNLEDAIEKLSQRQMMDIRKETERLASATNNGQNKKRVRELGAAIKKRLAQVTPPSTPTPTPSQSGGFQPIIPPPAQLSPTPK